MREVQVVLWVVLGIFVLIYFFAPEEYLRKDTLKTAAPATQATSLSNSAPTRSTFNKGTIVIECPAGQVPVLKLLPEDVLQPGCMSE